MVGLGGWPARAASGGLAGHLLLEREDVVEDPLHPPSFQTVAGYEAALPEQLPELQAEPGVDPHLAAFQGLLQNHQATIEHEQPVVAIGWRHVPITRTMPFSTLTAYLSRGFNSG